MRLYQTYNLKMNLGVLKDEKGADALSLRLDIEEELKKKNLKINGAGCGEYFMDISIMKQRLIRRKL